jgi:hypothetical protein
VVDQAQLCRRRIPPEVADVTVLLGDQAIEERGSEALPQWGGDGSGCALGPVSPVDQRAILAIDLPEDGNGDKLGVRRPQRDRQTPGAALVNRRGICP